VSGLGGDPSAGSARHPHTGSYGLVAAGFLYQLGVTLEWAEVQLLAKLGGWVPHKDRRPGKITLMRGLRRLLDTLATQAIRSPAAAQ
jgi:hypothetical protein